MALGLDLDLRGKAEAHELASDALTELRLGREQEVLRPAPDHDERRDDARLRGEEQRLARCVQVERDVVRQHSLEVVLRVGPGDADEGPWAPRDL